MNKSLKIQYLLLAFFLLGSTVAVFSQQGGSMQRFKEEKIKYFNEKLELTELEADKFWPLYEDLQNRKMKLNEDERSLLTYYSSNVAAMNNKEIDETTSKFMALQETRITLGIQYHDKFVEIIGKRKTMQMYALEREFKMYILEKFRGGRGPEEGKGQGIGRHRGGR
ncbi:hypothetical protein ACFLRQ_00605 [Bacteroidota bacterium]